MQCGAGAYLFAGLFARAILVYSIMRRVIWGLKICRDLIGARRSWLVSRSVVPIASDRVVPYNSVLSRRLSSPVLSD